MAVLRADLDLSTAATVGQVVAAAAALGVPTDDALTPGQQIDHLWAQLEGGRHEPPALAASPSGRAAAQLYDEFGMPLVLSLVVPYARNLPFHLALLATSQGCRAGVASHVERALGALQFSRFYKSYTVERFLVDLSSRAACPRDMLSYGETLISYADASFHDERLALRFDKSRGIPIYEAQMRPWLPVYGRAAELTLAQKALIVTSPWLARALPAEWPVRYLARLLQIDESGERDLVERIVEQWRETSNLDALAGRLGLPLASSIRTGGASTRHVR